MFKDHFSKTASSYARFRPRYPAALFEWLAGVAPGHALAWDAGTGNGQAAAALAKHFDRVIATDPSAEQIANAAPHARVTYRVARAESSAVATGSCDLVTAAQALHWFDPPVFFAEANRALRPGGVVAVWVYIDPHLVEPDVSAAFRDYAERIHPYWPPERAMTDDGYRSLAFPFDELNAPAFEMELVVTLEDCVGYLRTWSSTQRYLQRHGHDPVDEAERQLAQTWPRGERRTLRWPLHVRAGVRRP